MAEPNHSETIIFTDGKTTSVRRLLALFAFAIILLLTAWFRLSRQMARE